MVLSYDEINVGDTLYYNGFLQADSYGEGIVGVKCTNRLVYVLKKVDRNRAFPILIGNTKDSGLGWASPKELSRDPVPEVQSMPPQPTKMPENAAVKHESSSSAQTVEVIVADLCKEKFHEFKLIGGGGFGKVFQALSKETGEKVAVKYINKKSIKSRNPNAFENGKDPVTRELEVVKGLDHPNIVRFIDSIEDVINERLCIVFELFAS